MSEDENVARVDGDGVVVVRRGERVAPVVFAVGPTLSETLAAVADLPVTVAYTATPHPLDGDGLRDAIGPGRHVVLVEPYLVGTSAARVAAALVDRPHRLLSLGVTNPELRRYSTRAEHRAAHGLDAAGIWASIKRFLTAGT